MSLVTKLLFIGEPARQSRLQDTEINLHEHLTDDADWNAEFWDFDGEYLKACAEQLKRIDS